MSRRTNAGDRKRLGLKRETLRSLSARDLGQVAGGTWIFTEECHSDACNWSVVCSEDCQTGYSTGSRFC